MGGETTSFAGFRGFRGVSRCGRQKRYFSPAFENVYWQKNKFHGHKLEIAQGVVLSTPSATHLVGLPHQGSPLPYFDPSTLATIPPLLQPGHTKCAHAKICIYLSKKSARKDLKAIINHLQTYLGSPRPWDRQTRGEEKSWWWFEREIKSRQHR